MSLALAPGGTCPPPGADARCRAAAGRAAEDEEDDDDEELTAYAPGGVELAGDTALYTELVVLSAAGAVICLAVPIFECEFGVLIAVPVAHSECLPGPRLEVQVPASADDDAEQEAVGIELAVGLIDVLTDSFHRLAFAGDREYDVTCRFSADGDLPLAAALAEIADNWL